MVKKEKLYSIGEVKYFLNIPSHTLRYWEREFNEFLKPERTVGKQRRYGEEDLKMLKMIFKLLKHEKYSIAGAKQRLKNCGLENHSQKNVMRATFTDQAAEIVKAKLVLS